MESVQLLSLIIKKMEYTGDGVGIVWEERGEMQHEMMLHLHSGYFRSAIFNFKVFFLPSRNS